MMIIAPRKNISEINKHLLKSFFFFAALLLNYPAGKKSFEDKNEGLFIY